jgi:hypothetical protein
MRCMSQTPEPLVPPAPAALPPNSETLYRVAAWVVIIGGIILIAVSVLFIVCTLWSWR